MKHITCQKNIHNNFSHFLKRNLISDKYDGNILANMSVLVYTIAYDSNTAHEEGMIIADENEFFRELTLRICGTLDLEKALWQCFLYVSTIMPADDVDLIIYDSALGTIDVVATANAAGPISHRSCARRSRKPTAIRVSVLPIMCSTIPYWEE